MPAAHKDVVMFSGGIGSWAAGKRVAACHGIDNLTLLFADTLIEDEDLYRFLDEAAANVGGELVKIAEGRTPWDVYFDERFLGNSLKDPCSKILKRQPAVRWLKEHCDPLHTTVYVGIDWTEKHRFDDGAGGGLRPRRAAEGWRYEAPMCNAPFVQKDKMLEMLKEEGITPPRLYKLGFSHNNCGGFCCKAGQGAFARLLKEFPNRYAYHENEEREIRAYLNRDVSIMTDRRGDNKKKPLTMTAFRERIEAKEAVDQFEIGGCGCFVDEAPTA